MVAMCPRINQKFPNYAKAVTKMVEISLKKSEISQNKVEGGGLHNNKPKSSRSCRASFKNLGQQFGTEIWDKQTRPDIELLCN